MGSYYSDTGYKQIRKPIILVILFYFIYVAANIIANKGIMMAGVFIALPFIIAAVYILFSNPRLTLFLVLIFAFTINGIIRYIPAPLGLSTDGLLFLVMMSLFFKGWVQQDWSPAKNYLTWLSLIWMGYCVLEVVNPEMVSFAAWFYAMRGVGFYQLLFIPAALVLLSRLKDLDTFLKIWMMLSIIAVLKGFQQLILGPDPWEQAWLDAGAEETHILFGRLRVFSFYSDAGQFGAAMAHATLSSGIIALGPGTRKKKIFFGIASILTLLGMFISGTRGAMAVPAMGALLFLLLSKNFKLLMVGIAFGAVVFFFLKFTTIGQGNYQIARMRTALDPQDASLQVRLENQRKLKSYLATRPLGGGIGSAGNWGLRFSPNTFLAQTPTDSWFVKIWAEMGVVGLSLHLFILFYILIQSSIVIWTKISDPELTFILLALISGFWGIMVASYGNGILGQMPTLMVLLFSWVFLSRGVKLQEEKQKQLPENDNLLCISNGVRDMSS
ncbi:MAG: O-antigen ligase family protein [Bacteroidota bacterium]|nr:O-antigen ligase family protein [Bacteroidota bacterium]